MRVGARAAHRRPVHLRVPATMWRKRRPGIRMGVECSTGGGAAEAGGASRRYRCGETRCRRAGCVTATRTQAGRHRRRNRTDGNQAVGSAAHLARRSAAEQRRRWASPRLAAADHRRLCGCAAGPGSRWKSPKPPVRSTVRARPPDVGVGAGGRPRRAAATVWFSSGAAAACYANPLRHNVRWWPGPGPAASGCRRPADEAMHARRRPAKVGAPPSCHGPSHAGCVHDAAKNVLRSRKSVARRRKSVSRHPPKLC
jgi:hypothetical protein